MGYLLKLQGLAPFKTKKKLYTVFFAVRRIRETTNIETTTIAYHALSTHVRFGIVARGAASATELQNKSNTSEKTVRFIEKDITFSYNTPFLH